MPQSFGEFPCLEPSPRVQLPCTAVNLRNECLEWRGWLGNLLAVRECGELRGRNLQETDCRLDREVPFFAAFPDRTAELPPK